MRAVSLVLALGFSWPTAAVAQPAIGPAPDGTFALNVTGGQEVMDRLGFRADEHGTALVFLARALHGVHAASASGSLAVTFVELFGPLTMAASLPVQDGPDSTILAPFSDRTWRSALGLDDRADLFSSLVKSRGALLVAAGALQAGDGVRPWLEGQPRLLQQLIQQWPGAFALAGPALSLSGGRFELPGGADDEAGWTALVGASPARPEEFLRRLVARDAGQLARHFSTMASLGDGVRAALVEPLPGEDRSAALGAIYALARNAEAPWDANIHPYQLSYADLPSALHAIDDLDPGALPAEAGQWPALLTTDVNSRADAAALLRRPPVVQAYAATVRALLQGPPRRRRDRIAVLSMARRLWETSASAEAQTDAVYAMGHFRRYRALLLTLDSLDVKDPATWARAVDAARRVDAGGGLEREQKLGAFQGALALVERAHRVGSLDDAPTEAMVDSLARAVNSGAQAVDAVRGWLLDAFIPALPPLRRPDRFSAQTAYESRILQALAGPPAEAPRPFSWEGLDYAVDVVAAEHERIMRIRDVVPSPGLDAAIASGNAAALIAALGALAYAPALGDPDGNVALSPDVVTRHDFGGSRASPGREFAWLPAQERTGSGGPWQVAGSLLGLDLALARSALRRLSVDDMPAVPTINLNDQLTLARTAVALRPRDLDDATRDELAAAIVRGRARVAVAGQDVTALLTLGTEVAMTAARRRTLGWTLAARPDAGPTCFSLRDLLWLGQPRVETAVLHRWGVMGETVDGRLRTMFSAPRPWDRLAGRPDTGVLATQVPDLTLRMVEVTSARHIPATLIPALLLYATQDYWHEVEARIADDWPAMTRGAAALPATRVEDYVAALGSAGPLRPR